MALTSTEERFLLIPPLSPALSSSAPSDHSDLEVGRLGSQLQMFIACTASVSPLDYKDGVDLLSISSMTSAPFSSWSFFSVYSK
jgi:hypothetical protein